MVTKILSMLFPALALMSVAGLAQSSGGLTSGVLQGVPPRDVVVPATGRSTIRGRVLASDTAAPMRRAAVRLNGGDIRSSRVTTTDAEGRYEFLKLPAGRYAVNVSKPGYVNSSYGQTRINGISKPVTLSDNQVADNIDVYLVRGGVIAGRVVDEFGDPVPDVGVAALKQQYSQGRRQMVSVGARVQTNDIGEYRIFGLAPGQYFLSASPQAQFPGGPIALGSVSGERSGLAPTFYPSSPDAASAQRVSVAAGQTLTGVDISLVAAYLAVVSGVAFDSQGRPLGAGGIQAMQRGIANTGIGNYGASIAADGSFTILNLPPGEYVLRANSARPTPAPGAPFSPPEFATATVTVNGDDVTGVRLSPVAQASISGRILFDDTAAAQAVRPTTLRVMTQPLNTGDLIPFGALPDSIVRDDFTFVVKAYPGRVGLMAFAPVLPGGPSAAGAWQLKAIRANGLDVTDSGIDLGGQGLSGVEIELTNRVQQLTGSVTDERGSPATNYTVVVFAQDRARWLTPMGRYSAVARPSDDGKFKIMSLPPGEYFALALDGIDLSNWQDPDSLEALSRSATAFALTSGDSRTLDLKLVAAR